MRKSKFEIFIISHIIEIRKFLFFFLQTKNVKIITYIIFFLNREFRNLYFSCKLKSAVFYFYESHFENILFFPQKGIQKFSPFFRDSIFAANNTRKYYFNMVSLMRTLLIVMQYTALERERNSFTYLSFVSL